MLCPRPWIVKIHILQAAALFEIELQEWPSRIHIQFRDRQTDRQTTIQHFEGRKYSITSTLIHNVL